MSQSTGAPSLFDDGQIGTGEIIIASPNQNYRRLI